MCLHVRRWSSGSCSLLLVLLVLLVMRHLLVLLVLLVMRHLLLVLSHLLLVLCHCHCRGRIHLLLATTCTAAPRTGPLGPLLLTLLVVLLEGGAQLRGCIVLMSHNGRGLRLREQLSIVARILWRNSRHGLLILRPR